MISFRDMTFCPFHEDCAKAKDCKRPLTKQVEKDAEAWWGLSEGGAPISLFSDKPECHEVLETTE